MWRSSGAVETAYLFNIVDGIPAAGHFGDEGRGCWRAVVFPSLRDELVHGYKLGHFSGFVFLFVCLFRGKLKKKKKNHKEIILRRTHGEKKRTEK